MSGVILSSEITTCLQLTDDADGQNPSNDHLLHRFSVKRSKQRCTESGCSEEGHMLC